jgi:uncharacterized membrane protein
MMLGLLLPLTALASLQPAVAQKPLYHVTELPLVTNATAAEVTSINNAGQVVGFTPGELSTKSYTGWLWTPSTSNTAARIEALAPLRNFPHSRALDINDKGYIVGRSSGNGQSATFWHASTPLAPVNFNDPAVKGTVLPNCVLTDAFALSDADTNGFYYVTGYCAYTDPVTGVVSRWQGVVWKMQGTTMVSGVRLQYPDAPPANLEDLVTDPWDVNSQGQVAGDYSKDWYSAITYPCIWSAEDGRMVQLSSADSNAHAINEAGLVVGMSYTTSPPKAFLWAAPSKIQILPDPSGGHAVASGINKWNQIVGKVYSKSAWRPSLWQPQADGTFQHYYLNDCKYSGATRITLQTASKVNNSGWIIGGYTSSKASRAYLLTPR